MSTLYELFNVDENASQQEITNAYQKIIEKADSLLQTEELSQKIQRIKIAYGILSNPDKRKKYDLDLATKRADALLETIKTREEINEQEEREKTKLELNVKQLEEEHPAEQRIDTEKLRQSVNEVVDKAIVENNQKLVEKEHKKQEQKAKRMAKKELEYKREKEIQDYGRYLESQGYKVKYPWTWPRVRRLLISIVIISITIFILWHIPFVKKSLVSVYEENFIIKGLVDIVVSLFSSIFGGMK